jgi:hypothetical protein
LKKRNEWVNIEKYATCDIRQEGLANKVGTTSNVYSSKTWLIFLKKKLFFDTGRDIKTS